jgi:hypothetical protein
MISVWITSKQLFRFLPGKLTLEARCSQYPIKPYIQQVWWGMKRPTYFFFQHCRAHQNEASMDEKEKMTHAIDASIFTPGFTFCAIAVTIEGVSRYL